ncbi:MAG: hypothetical protein M3355_02660 [Actinomycetota bacterium]|nr:hypothetical protein [Actinomycetota bacterium]
MRNALSSRPARSLAGIIAAGALALGGASCGDDEESSSEGSSEETASAEEVNLVATEYEFELSATPTADTTSVTFDNQGEEFHVLVFARINEGYTLDEAYELEGKKGSATSIVETEAAPGESTTVEIEEPIEPGSYAMLCPIPDKDGPHYKLGQLQEFDIE